METEDRRKEHHRQVEILREDRLKEGKQLPPRPTVRTHTARQEDGEKIHGEESC